VAKGEAVRQTNEGPAVPARSAVRILISQAAGRLAASAGLGLVAGLAEASVLLLIVRSALAITDQANEPVVQLPVLSKLSLTAAALVGFALLVARLVLQLAGGWLSADAYARVRLRWLGQVVERALRSRWEDVANQAEGTFGELTSAVVPHAAAAVLNLAILAQQAASLAILLVVTFLVNPGAALGALLSVAALALVIRPLSRLIRRQAARSIEEEQRLATGIAQITRSMVEVRAFGVEHEVDHALMASAHGTARIWRRVNFGGLASVAVYQAAALGLILAGIGILGRGDPARLAGIGTVLLILIRAFAYGQALQAQMAALQSAAPAVLRIEQALRSLPLAAGDEAGQAVPRPLAQLRLRAVSYWYRPDQPVIDRYELSVVAGEVVGLRGPSGTGKTTLLHLLLGLRTPREGTYEVNGVDVAVISRLAWTSAVGFVPQEPMLIEGTIAENIRFFRPDLTEEQLHHAALRAGLGPDLALWPDGLERLVGQRRHGVSGGQRQRITIARALAGDPLVLLMDEPTSSLDEEAERVVLETLRALKGQLTVIVAAHRSSTLGLCDRVIELERPIPTAEVDGMPSLQG